MGMGYEEGAWKLNVNIKCYTFDQCFPILKQSSKPSILINNVHKNNVKKIHTYSSNRNKDDRTECFILIYCQAQVPNPSPKSREKGL